MVFAVMPVLVIPEANGSELVFERKPSQPLA